MALNNPVNDAGLIAEALKADGFRVTVANNLDRKHFIAALKAFASEADAAHWAVVYFAGHNVEVQGINYLIPIDTKVIKPRDIDLDGVPVDQMMSAIDGARVLRVFGRGEISHATWSASTVRALCGSDSKAA